ncbi:MAG: hypothetical protein WCL50_11915 [Spirochaetota bacterium]
MSLKGATGDAGQAGGAGTNGATWYSDSVDPDAYLGANGDLFLNTSSTAVWRKVGGAWSSVVTLKESAGTAGLSIAWQGSLASAPTTGILTNWAYYDTVLKISRIWDGSAWQILAIDGEAGATGQQGPAGAGITRGTGAGASPQGAANVGHLVDNTAQVTITLPAFPAVGDIVQVTGKGSGGWRVAQNAGQSIVTRGLTPMAGIIWTTRESARNWSSVASSYDGNRLVAFVQNGQIYTSSDVGFTWTLRASSPIADWWSVASSSDGTMLAACVWSGQIYISSDAGLTWSPRMTDQSKYWSSIAHSSDGARLVACANMGLIYTSSDAGGNWTARMNDLDRNWTSAASSSDGKKLVACVDGGQIYNSSDAGLTWTARMTDLGRNWWWVYSSSDGTKHVACTSGNGGQIYTSSSTSMPSTTPDTAGFINGGQFGAIELQCLGGGIFAVLSHEGCIDVQ